VGKKLRLDRGSIEVDRTWLEEGGVADGVAVHYELCFYPTDGEAKYCELCFFPTPFFRPTPPFHAFRQAAPYLDLRGRCGDDGGGQLPHLPQNRRV
jgi:hypothetical protein